MSVPASTDHRVACVSPAGVHQMAYKAWGDPQNPKVLLCLHGLLRTGRDFDALAQTLSPHYRVICPDFVGRGKSDWLADPSYYTIPQYVADTLTLLQHLQPERVDWVGTSMGGLITLSVASMLSASSFTTVPTWQFGKIVLNDVGPVLDPAGLARIAQYISDQPRFDSWHQAVIGAQKRWASFGPHSYTQWEHLARYVFMQQGSHWVNAYDHGIAEAFRQQLELDQAQNGQLTQLAQQTLWHAFEHLPNDCLIVRGEFSDLLSPDTAHEMLTRQPKAGFYQVAGVGHAPTLMQADQLHVLSQFLLKD
ncbi:pimeloyl-ACP methyl ester carboxylesterase [Paenalcaligenes hominis]|uniref:Pimeloyl-ACP methyl ester carboxylesterase n=1 Tax=Paenalcaligenes hominis TaxID=643674 RepID=A0ABX0WMJ8_9BURK|nr:alpha/beta hydrolase [Paenalcaligenes hominis]NJB64261.1 pimeloyl-ACP methyl ester carboxylesterase [Paenalcaligenes hominis]GGE68965.1 alpha/beta hydrolase [Paenalcaligenes hominis]